MFEGLINRYSLREIWAGYDLPLGLFQIRKGNTCAHLSCVLFQKLYIWSHPISTWLIVLAF